MPQRIPNTRTRIVAWIAQLTAAAILAQTLFFKFTGAAESVFIFEQLGVEPWGRYLTGSLELLAVVLLLVPRTAAAGAVLVAGLMAGAIGSHITTLGIEVQDDGGLLFGLGIVTMVAALVILAIRRREIPFIGSWFDKARSTAADAHASRA